MTGITILIIGLIALIAAVVVSLFRTPDNLRGFYGAMFISIAVIGAILAVALLFA